MSLLIKKFRKKLITTKLKLPIWKPLFQVIKKVYLPSMEVRQKLNFIGPFEMKLDDTKTLKLHNFGFFIENEMFWTGLKSEWEHESVRIWIELAKKSDVIFDIGANTGIFSLLARGFNPSAKIYGFEPQPNIYDCFSKQIALNHFDIKAYQLALSNQNGSTKFYNYGFDTFNSNTTAGSLNQEFRNLATQQAIDVETIRLEDFLKRENIDRIDLMKIDVESFEPQVLEGAGEALKNLQPIILIEIQSDEVGKKVQDLLHPMQYDIYNIDEHKGLVKVEKLIDQEFKNHLIVPLSKKKIFDTCRDNGLALSQTY